MEQVFLIKSDVTQRKVETQRKVDDIVRQLFKLDEAVARHKGNSIFNNVI
jgi:hypothetical protein